MADSSSIEPIHAKAERIATVRLGSIEEPDEEHPQRDTVLRCGDRWIVLLPENTNSCAPSVHKLDDIRAEVAARPNASWWRNAVLALVDAADYRDRNRCAVCGWGLADSRETGCVRGDCSMRPRPENLYDLARAEREADNMRKGVPVDER